jgi:nitrogen fixation/metabolism regulation signal transduction histidine kinase
LSVFIYFFQSNLIEFESNLRKQSVNKKANQLLKDLKDKASQIDVASQNFQTLAEDRKKGVSWLIFEDSKLIYWSSNDYVIESDILEEPFTLKRINNYLGKFIAYKFKNKNITSVALILLERNYQVEGSSINTYKNLFLFPSIKNQIIASDEVIDSDEKGLFGYKIEFTDLTNDSFVTKAFTLLTIVSILLFSYIIFSFVYISINRIKIIWVILLLVLVRTVFFLLNNYILLNIDFFNSTYYASSILSRSLADLFVNTLMLGFVCILLLKLKVTQQLYVVFLKASSPLFRTLIVLSLTLGVLLINSYFYNFISSLVTNSTISIDVNDILNWHYSKLVFITLIFIVGLISFYTFHLLFTIQYKLNTSIKFVYLVMCFLFFIIYLLSKDMYYLVIGLSMLYAFLVLYFRLFNLLKDMRYEAFLYLFLFAFSYSSIIGITLYNHLDKKMIRSKNEYLENIVNKRDLITEYLLNDVSKKIKSDLFIVDKILSPFSESTQLRKFISKKYLNDFYKGYAVQVEVYENNGALLQKNARKQLLSEYVKNIVFKSNYIKENDLYLIYDLLNSKRTYIAINSIVNNNRIIGYVVVELTSKINIESEPNASFLQNISKLTNDRITYDYAIINNHTIEVSNGHFLYNSNFINYFLAHKNSFDNSFIYNGYHHVFKKTEDSKWVVVSTPYSFFDYLISNASFFFICSGVVLLVFIFMFLFFQRKSNTHLSFATRIQIYLNAGFFIPLFIASIITLYLVDKNYQSVLQEQYVRLSENLSDILTTKTIEKNKINLERVNEVIHLSEDFTLQPLDFSIFSFNSNLLVSNNDEFYSKEIKSKKINFDALTAVKNGSQFLLTNESIANFNYYSIYRSIKSSETGKPIAILHVPFYASNKILNEQVLIYVKLAMNLFVIGFLILLIFGFFVAHQLTIPLRLITQGIRKTGLEDNERIEWNSDDELGRLVKEYNTMLVKIEESTQNLSKAEKESAWREMARQVAHEIKNPLTPIKLKLQYLIYRIQQSGMNLSNEELKDAYQAMLLQIDTITEITNSFSAFNQLPQANPEVVNVNEFLQDVALVHQSENLTIDFELSETNSKVYADKKIVTGILNNLLLNAQQSIPSTRIPYIKIKTDVQLSTVKIFISDNGMGIPEEIKHKIFVPNFSTKYSGSGIGLALAKRLVEDMNGTITFESTLNIGTVFIIELPLYTPYK